VRGLEECHSNPFEFSVCLNFRRCTLKSSCQDDDDEALKFESSEIKYSTDFGYILYYKLKFAKFVQFSTVQNKFSTIS